MRVNKDLTTRTYGLLPAKEGYDLAAPWYDKWHWTEFWKRNELPLVGTLLDDLTPARVLDAGSGTGAYRFELEARGHQIVAIDISSKMLGIQAQKARFFSHDNTTKLFNGDIQDMPAEWSESFNYIVCARVLSHIANPLVPIREFSRVLKRGGRLIITDVDPSHPYKHVKISNGSVHSMIRAFKHGRHELEACFSAAYLRIEMFKRVALRDLSWLPSQDTFAKIYYASEQPIFFICVLTK